MLLAISVVINLCSWEYSPSKFGSAKYFSHLTIRLGRIAIGA
jgi:hypothetical protein